MAATSPDADPTIRIEAKFKNARLYNAIAERSVPLSSGAKNIALHASGPVKAFCELHGLTLQRVYLLLSMKMSPLMRAGSREASDTQYKPLCMTLAAILEHPVEWLFPLDIYNVEWPAVCGDIHHGQMVSLAHARARPELMLPAMQDAIIDQQDKLKSIEHALSTLTPREGKVIRLRFGLGGGDEHPLKEVGVALGVSTERVRQIEAKALRKLRHKSRSRALRGYLTAEYQVDEGS